MSKMKLTVALVLTLGGGVVMGCPSAARAHDISADQGLWGAYNSALLHAKYVDLTHAFSPNTPLGNDFAKLKFFPTLSARTIPNVIKAGEPIIYETQGYEISGYELSTDQIGTQLDPPAHGNEHGATISDLPPTFSVRPLVVINVADKVKADPGYQASMDDIHDWEKQHGQIPQGSVVMFRTDWYKNWSNPERFKTRPFPGTQLEVLKYLHLERHILFHGHEPLDTDNTPNYASETWLMRNSFAQAEGVANLDQMPESGGLIEIGFAKPEGGTGGLARFIGIAPSDWKYGVTIEQQPGAPLPTYTQPLRRDADGVLRSPG
ncbi:cyclase family protein [Mesorhizobium sp. M0659]|uniref:cyclase family protein n=1 Tax=Mesorhizobium sp. M0659 TaxID=2956980 RepID=UPI00333DC09C